jgi:putative thiamine transport system substrate-binding protein
MVSLRSLLLVLAALVPLGVGAQTPVDWSDVLAAARGRTVHFNAWGGKDEINDYVAWVGAQVKARHGIELIHVKLADTADAVARIVAERQADLARGGAMRPGSVDLLWANGENFARLKAAGLLFGPWAERAPNFAWVDRGKPTNFLDFGTPVEGMAAPYGFFQLNFVHDGRRVPTPPRSAGALLAWIKANPGRFTYPSPANFIGHSFLKQLARELAVDPAALDRPVAAVDPAAVTAPLWAWLAEARPHLWRRGATFPEGETALRQLLADGEVDFSISFGPGETSAAIEQGLLPPTTRTFVFDGGTVGNTSFVMIAYNSAVAAAAMVVADFLMSPEAQARKQDPRVWGAFTVLDVARLPPADRARFDALPLGVATLDPVALGRPLSEPHFTWTEWLQAEWRRRHEGR